MILKRAAALALGILMMIPATTAYAEGSSTNLNNNSTATVTFKKGGDGEEPGGEDGSWKIVSVSDFKFSGTISETKATYPLETQDANVQVLDLRGTGEGWTLSAELGEFTDGDDSSSLNGAAIHITGGFLSSETNSEYAPAVKEAVLSSDVGPRPIMTAGEDKGIGLWMDSFQYGEETYVHLVVPPTLIKANVAYTAPITWTLSNTP